MPLGAIHGGTAEKNGPTVRPVVLCGGSGSRLWPLSRALHPKQLLPVAHRNTMLQATLARTHHPLFSKAVVVSNEEHRFLVKDQIEAAHLDCDAIILEPEGRNTAAAIAVAAQWAQQVDPDQILLVMPSDHVIGDSNAFWTSVAAALPAAESGAFVTFGIHPSRPETGYGYIEAADSLEHAPDVLRVTRFVEKPDLKTAESYCASGCHFWNGGIFMFRASSYLSELSRLAPDIASKCEIAMKASTCDDLFIRPAAEPFLACPSISIDYAVMEKTDKACVIPVSMDWSDVGSWDALWEISPKDDHENVIVGDVIALQSHGSLIRSEGNLTVAAAGIDNLVVVATRDAVLVVPRERAQDTKLLVEALKRSGHDKHSVHPQVHRPWGTYETTDQGERFQTKRLVVRPGEKLSLQMHHQRSEHWIVVRGTARVTVGDQVRLLQENESTFVPAGTLHRLENPGKIPLHLIEVQCGPYLGEDDIVRFEDSYGRLPSVA